jgi:hypothetical protein
MDGQALKAMLEAMLPPGVIGDAVKALGVQEKRRKLDVVALVRAMVLCGGSPRFGHQAQMLDAYLDMEVPRVTRSAFYQWFCMELAALTAHLGSMACDWVASRPVHLPGPLAGVTDWRVFDSTTVRVPDALIEQFRGCGDYAALKVHKEYSLGCENVVAYSISAAHEHDGRHLVIDERRRGSGLIVDLGYVSHAMLEACAQHDVKVIVRLKKGWHVWFDEGVDDATIDAWIDDPTLDTRIDLDQLEARAPGAPLDVDVTFGPVGSTVRMRLVSVPTETGHCVFLTNLPRATHDHAEIGLLYRLRWCIELDNKLAKTGFQLDEIDARTVHSALVVVHASMLASIVANAFVHETNLARGLVGQSRKRIKEPPLHPLLVASRVASLSRDLAELLSDPEAPPARWERCASLIVHRGSDPNWRKRPSASDVVKGRTPALLDPRRYAREPVHALRVLN